METDLNTYAYYALIDGSCYQGQVKTTYTKLLETFGKPIIKNGSKDKKCQKEWVIVTLFGIATIYDWKENVPPEKVTNWHIGGFNDDVVRWIKNELA